MHVDCFIASVGKLTTKRYLFTQLNTMSENEGTESQLTLVNWLRSQNTYVRKFEFDRLKQN